jgi:mRNA-degrading endonuclease YafQ of YafQ-DinJ toxin-antitoxin module
MLLPEYTKHFERDVKKLRQKHKNMEELKKIVDMIVKQIPLPAKYFNHFLIRGKYYICNRKIVGNDI